MPQELGLPVQLGASLPPAAVAEANTEKLLGELRRTAMRALRALPVARTHQDFAVPFALGTMEFVNRHGGKIATRDARFKREGGCNKSRPALMKLANSRVQQISMGQRSNKLAGARRLACWSVLLLMSFALSAPGAEQAYVVRRNDTLSSIARRHGVAVSELVERNNLSGRNFVYIGQRLIIPSQDPRPSRHGPAMTAAIQRSIDNAPVAPGPLEIHRRPPQRRG